MATKIYPPKYLETGTVNGEPTFPQGYEVVEVEADDSSYYQDSYKNSTFIELHFKMNRFYDFKKYSRLEHHLHCKVGLGGSLGSKNNIVMLEEPTFEKFSDTHYEYKLKFYNAWREKYNRRYVKDPQTGSTSFSLTGNERQHLECIVRSVCTDWYIDDRMMSIYLGQYSGLAHEANYNGAESRQYSPFWQISPDFKTVTYEGTTCADALNQLSELYGHEYNYNFEYMSYLNVMNSPYPWIDADGKFGFRLYSDEAENSTALMYGKGKGLKQIKATGEDGVDILYVNGSNKNLFNYAFPMLRMPRAVNGNRAVLLYNGSSFLPATGVYREGGNYNVPVGYVEYVASARGAAVMKRGISNEFGRDEVVSIPDVYPNRVGSLTGVSTINSGGTTYYKVYDSTINIDDYHVSEGIVGDMMIIFQSGMLAGLEFDVQQRDSEYSYHMNKDSYNREDGDIVVRQPYTDNTYPKSYSRTVKSFTLSSQGVVSFINIVPFFEFSANYTNSNNNYFGSGYAFTARCYLQKVGGSEIFSNNLSVWSPHNQITTNKVALFRSTGESINRTVNLSAGTYNLVIELVFNPNRNMSIPFVPSIQTYVTGKIREEISEVFYIAPKTYNDVELPNSTLHPVVGDEYVIVNIEMQQSYVETAEVNLFKEAVKILEEYLSDGTTYQVEIDGKFMNNNDTINQGLSSGLCLKIQDSSFMTPARTFRIVNVKRPYNDENSPRIEISNVKKKKSRIDGFTHSILDLYGINESTELRVMVYNEQTKSSLTKLSLQNADTNFNLSVLENDVEEIKARLDKMS